LAFKIIIIVIELKSKQSANEYILSVFMGIFGWFCGTWHGAL